jgi:hypothetical protein
LLFGHDLDGVLGRRKGGGAGGSLQPAAAILAKLGLLGGVFHIDRSFFT